MPDDSFRYGRWLEQTFFANKPAEYLMLLLVSAVLIIVRTRSLENIHPPSLFIHIPSTPHVP